MQTIPLFRRYPGLREKIPHRSLGVFPTNVEKLDKFGRAIGSKKIYIKRDDQCGKVFGGNKTRKLEFILARALELGKKEIITFGGVGSNHATATAVYSSQLGLKSISMLMPQTKNPQIPQKLLLSYHSGAELHYLNVEDRRLAVIRSISQLLKHWFRCGTLPYVIPFGGSSPLGTVGFVNAAFELKNQISEGLLPEPDIIYVAMGSTGTSVGLTLGLRAANMRTRVKPVRVLDRKYSNEKKFVALFRKTNRFLRTADSSFPHCEITGNDLDMVHDFFGQRYAQHTNEGIEAMSILEKSENILLEGTYTGKACAALIQDARQGVLDDKVVLFWNTCNSRDFSQEISAVDYRNLPSAFHEYF